MFRTLPPRQHLCRRRRFGMSVRTQRDRMQHGGGAEVQRNLPGRQFLRLGFGERSMSVRTCRLRRFRPGPFVFGRVPAGIRVRKRRFEM